MGSLAAQQKAAAVAESTTLVAAGFGATELDANRKRGQSTVAVLQRTLQELALQPAWPPGHWSTGSGWRMGGVVVAVYCIYQAAERSGPIAWVGTLMKAGSTTAWSVGSVMDSVWGAGASSRSGPGS